MCQGFKIQDTEQTTGKKKGGGGSRGTNLLIKLAFKVISHKK